MFGLAWRAVLAGRNECPRLARRGMAVGRSQTDKGDQWPLLAIEKSKQDRLSPGETAAGLMSEDCSHSEVSGGNAE